MNSNLNIEELFKWVDKVGNDIKYLTIQSLEQYFSKDIQYYINGILETKNINELYERFENILKHLTSHKVQYPIQTTLANDIAAVKYDLHTVLTDGIKKQSTIVAIIRYKDQKIVKWDAVIESK